MIPKHLLLMITLTLTARAAVFLPAVTGPHGIGTHDFFINANRTDVLAPAPETRGIMSTLYYPTSHNDSSTFPPPPYMPPRTASFYEAEFQLPNGTISQINTNSHYGAPITSPRDVKLIIFSTGFGASRTVYATLLEELASHGYLVVALDSTYDSPIVEFPDGSVRSASFQANITMEEVAKYYDERVKDVLAVVKTFHTPGLTSSIPGAGGEGLKVKRVAIFGHSLGGATAAGAIAADRRFLGGVNLDGAFFGDVIKTGVKKPFLIFGAQGHNRTVDQTWKSFWDADTKGWKRELSLKDSEHLTFSDFAPLIELMGLRNIFPKDELDAFVGTIGGVRALTIQRAYLKAFFDKVLCARRTKLFDGPDPEYPEISFI